MCDIDGQLARSFGLVACVSGRSAADARRLVGVGGIAYAGSHGAELLEPGAKRPTIDEDFKRWEGDVDAFVALRRLEHDGALDASVLVGVRSDEGPPAIVERADLVVDGVDGFTRVLAALAET